MRHGRMGFDRATGLMAVGTQIGVGTAIETNDEPLTGGSQGFRIPAELVEDCENIIVMMLHDSRRAKRLPWTTGGS